MPVADAVSLTMVVLMPPSSRNTIPTWTWKLLRSNQSGVRAMIDKRLRPGTPIVAWREPVNPAKWDLGPEWSDYEELALAVEFS